MAPGTHGPDQRDRGLITNWISAEVGAVDAGAPFASFAASREAFPPPSFASIRSFRLPTPRLRMGIRSKAYLRITIAASCGVERSRLGRFGTPPSSTLSGPTEYTT
jgi:hypothetical protein